MGVTHRVGSDRRRRHRPRGGGRGPQGRRPPASRSSPSTTTSAARYLSTGEVLPDRCSTSCAARCDPARCGRDARGPARRARAGPAAQDAVRARPLREPATLQAPRHGSTSSWCVRTLKAPTRAKAASSARAPARDRDPGLGQHPDGRRALRPLRLRAGQSRRASTSRSCTRRTCSPSPATCGTHVRRGRREYPTSDRVQPRRRGVHLLRAGPAAVRRDRHRQPVRRHPHRPRRRSRRVASAAPRRRTSTPPAPVRRCSSRSTARHPTSPAPARPTQSPPSCRRR